MRVLLWVTITFFLLFSGYHVTAQHTIITYNIRFNNPGDGEHAWPNRSADVINLLKFHKAEIFCLQEALHGQVEEINEAFADFSYVGVGRDDGKQKGEYAPIFYDTKKYKEIESGNFWLSEFPDIPALGWDAACIRICTWIILEELDLREQIMVFNTHFDHVGELARKNAADLILKKIQKEASGKPVILCGDFNLPPESVPIQKLSAVLNDSYMFTELPPHGARGTWTGFTYKDTPGARIDYIFVSEDLRVLRYAALTDSRDGNYFSDHLPVLVEVDLTY
jgi:endonuclease/exonuclease/phosphatase family metal-dependent hydrolase